ncbi:bifunctional diaminohydroxyphosphoribosylaminopyrimidine deaminase/5-amino-6-(5-phosphoribosylamino)uracil reductase RibD [Maribacter chungangensis]|uniref:Riboflavin biosynthesis protein RibD n=1 Tax=Maribacter chungangensis TaxID=1069117 RepID=A0ABW3B3N2_9FLAO
MQTALDKNVSQATMDEKFMRRCIQLAKNGLGTTAPNPMVGAVIVHDNKIIGEGFTSPFGGPHAEVNAMAAVTDKEILTESTLYVTLEPCSHFGKTPPCADLIVKHRIPRVVIGLKDPHNKVAGQGIQKLKDTGCEVVIGILGTACREHHKRFLSFHEKQRPYIILKWAESSDGFIAPEKQQRHTSPQPFWITGSLSKQLVHKWRSEEQAILVGTATVLEDNPKLNVRLWTGKSPTRIILDKDLTTPHSYNVLDKKQRTIVFTTRTDTTKYIDGIEYVTLDEPKNGPEAVCKHLHHLNIQSVIIEGGAKTLQSFIDANLWDEARIFTGVVRFTNGIEAPRIKGNCIHYKYIEKDRLTILKND